MLSRLEMKISVRDLARASPMCRMQRQDLPSSGTLLPGEAIRIFVGKECFPEGLKASWGLVGAFLDRVPAKPLMTIPLKGLAERPFYGRLFREQRCLVVASALIFDHGSAFPETRLMPSGAAWLLGGVYDCHPLVGPTFALLNMPAMHRGSVLPMLLSVEEAQQWLQPDDDAVPELLSSLSGRAERPIWFEDFIPRPEPSPQLCLGFI